MAGRSAKDLLMPAGYECRCGQMWADAQTHKIHSHSQGIRHMENPVRPSAGPTPPAIIGRAGRLNEFDYA
jgi:hypothetical protein